MLHMTSNISMLIFYAGFACVFLLSVQQVAVVVTEPDSEQLEDIRVQPTERQVESIEAGNTEPSSHTHNFL